MGPRNAPAGPPGRRPATGGDPDDGDPGGHRGDAGVALPPRRAGEPAVQSSLDLSVGDPLLRAGPAVDRAPRLCPCLDRDDGELGNAGSRRAGDGRGRVRVRGGVRPLDRMDAGRPTRPVAHLVGGARGGHPGGSGGAAPGGIGAPAGGSGLPVIRGGLCVGPPARLRLRGGTSVPTGGAARAHSRRQLLRLPGPGWTARRRARSSPVPTGCSTAWTSTRGPEGHPAGSKARSSRLDPGR